MGEILTFCLICTDLAVLSPYIQDWADISLERPLQLVNKMYMRYI